MKINNKSIGESYPCFIIAEIGMNHDGNKDKAKQLIQVASDAGVDAVKFQTFKATDIINPTLPSDYDPQEPVPKKYKFFYQYIEQYELPYDWHDELIKYSQKNGVIFISTPCSIKAVRFLSTKIPAFKVASMDLNNIVLLKEIGQQKKPVILSTGIGSLSEIERAVMTLRDNGASDVAILHCISNYPAKPEELNLKNIPMLKKAFNLPVGFSDHSTGIVSAIVAVSLGACIIEKHITLSRNTPGPDHYFALEPHELKDFVQYIRNAQSSLGKSTRKLGTDEILKKSTYRRSLLTSKDLKAGHRLKREDIVIIRPGTGIDPFEILKVEGMILKKDLSAYTPLKWEYFK